MGEVRTLAKMPQAYFYWQSLVEVPHPHLKSKPIVSLFQPNKPNLGRCTSLVRPLTNSLLFGDLHLYKSNLTRTCKGGSDGLNARDKPQFELILALRRKFTVLHMLHGKNVALCPVEKSKFHISFLLLKRIKKGGGREHFVCLLVHFHS